MLVPAGTQVTYTAQFDFSIWQQIVGFRTEQDIANGVWANLQQNGDLQLVNHSGSTISGGTYGVTYILRTLTQMDDGDIQTEVDNALADYLGGGVTLINSNVSVGNVNTAIPQNPNPLSSLLPSGLSVSVVVIILAIIALFYFFPLQGKSAISTLRG